MQQAMTATRAIAVILENNLLLFMICPDPFFCFSVSFFKFLNEPNI